MTTITREVRILFDKCAKCGRDIIGDNTGDGRPWQHVDGEPHDDSHFPAFGFLAGDRVRIASLLELEDVLTVPENPGPGTPRPATEEEIGNNRSGRRQIINLAEKHGFTVTTSVCTGPVKAQGEQGWRLVDSFGLAMVHPDGRHAVACWESKAGEGDWSYLFAMCSGTTAGLVGSPGLKRYLIGETNV